MDIPRLADRPRGDPARGGDLALSSPDLPPQRISCVIPAYNEAPRIGHVLAAVVGHPAIDEVIVVDDGSTDGTAEAARTAAGSGAEVVVLDRNGGKTAAVAAGVAAARNPFILLLDSDLVGLTPEHVTALVAPVVAGRADVALSLRENAPGLWQRLGLDYISGERLVPRDLLEEALEDRLPRFGLEVQMNRLWVARRLRIAVVPWGGVSSPLKRRKLGLRAGVTGDIGMMRDIFGVLPPHRLVAQIWRMRRQRVR